jgi:L,D-transpeptidase ErfK/SrfK
MRWGILSPILHAGILLSISALAPPAHAGAAEYDAPRDGIIGAIGTYRVTQNDSLIELARKFDLGYNEIVAANPGVDPILPETGTNVTIPAKWILPDVPRRDGIVINLAEMRLYYFPTRHRGRVLTFPIGIGDEGWETPTGTFRIIEKIVNPSWYVPKSIRRQKPGLPPVVPPGPDNPLGTHALRLSIGTVLIHGTDRPFGIGRKVSHGCIHLYPEDIRALYRHIKVGTKVTIVRQPVKATVVGGRVMVEIHGNPEADLNRTAYELVVRKGLIERVNLEKLAVAAAKKSGMPHDVTWEIPGRGT